MEVREVLNRLANLGLEIRGRSASGHHKVYDPNTGAWLFDVANSPGDPNWYYNIARNLRRMGLSLETEKIKRGYKPKKPQSAIDLDALQRAQEAARAAGEREPQLSDLDDAPPTSPLWKRVKQSGSRPLSEAAQTEVIENMTVRAEDAKLKYLRGRLENFFAEKSSELEARARQRSPKLGIGKGAKSEFVRIAMEEVGPKRNLRTWKSVESGQQTLAYFMKNENSGMSNWTRKLVEATMDHIEGLRWGIVNGGEVVEEAAVTIALDPPTEDELDAEIVRQRDEADTGERISIEDLQAQVDADEAQAEKDARAEEDYKLVAPPKPADSKVYPSPSYRERYIEVLLKMLENGKHSDEVVAMEIMPRLDKLLLGGE